LNSFARAYRFLLSSSVLLSNSPLRLHAGGQNQLKISSGEYADLQGETGLFWFPLFDALCALSIPASANEQ
jgi:hypothetical protein